MRVYDFMLKLEGMKALCGGGIPDDSISATLSPAHEVGEQRSILSRLKSGQHDLSDHHKEILTGYFNKLLSERVLTTDRNALEDTARLLRADDWDRPLPEFFGHLATTLETLNPDSLARAHTGILAALHGLNDYRERDHALLVARYDPADAESYRFPSSAARVDPEDLPLGRIKSGKPMIAALTKPICDQPERGWLFFVRNPDERQGLSQSHYVWDQDLNDLIYWHQANPFEIPPQQMGALPGFPASATRLTGIVTAFLIVEPLDSAAVASLIREVAPNWLEGTPPPFESIAHLITCERRLFQRGNAKSFAKGTLPYKPSRLFVRRYKIDA